MATATATSKVINTPELLEDILLRLSMRDILLSQRVNRAFQSTTEGSPALQTALFMRPPHTVTHPNAKNIDIITNPLLNDSAITVPGCGFNIYVHHEKEQGIVSYSVIVIGDKIWPPRNASWKKMYLTDLHIVSQYGDPAMVFKWWKTQREPIASFKSRNSSMSLAFSTLEKAGTVYTPTDLDDDGWLVPNTRSWLRDFYRTALKEIVHMEDNPTEYELKYMEQLDKLEELRNPDPYREDDHVGFGLRPEFIMRPEGFVGGRAMVAHLDHVL